ncbi:hypothetical protein Acor_26570 [Acrocarpospora corrugata]|uniref:Uncharacterized protein n=1 Tax=Acrocarpospora corrugata TaxID=35763 RepID=A0A5M3VZS7_9ACTN|nr:hypothetical protein Acor_26570 [Acrocarpospora corrugata]
MAMFNANEGSGFGEGGPDGWAAAVPSGSAASATAATAWIKEAFFDRRNTIDEYLWREIPGHPPRVNRTELMIGPVNENPPAPLRASPA